MKRKKILLLIIIPLGVILLLFLLNLFVKNKIENRLQDTDTNISYESLNVNIYLNRFGLEDIQTRQDKFSLTAREIIVNGVSYSKIISSGDIEIDKVEVRDPQVILYTGDSGNGSEQESRDMKLEIGEILLKNGNFSSKENDTADASVYIRFPEVRVKPRDKDISSLQPESYSVHLDSVWLKMNAEHFVTVESVEAEDGKIQISDLSLGSFYSKQEFDRNIPYEKDRMDLQIPSISMENLSFDQRNDTLHFSDSKMVISEAFLEIYRNKLIADDPRRKPLYGELLREAPIKLNLEQVLVEKSEIIYEELVQEGRQAGVLRFSGVEGEINHLNNLRDSLPQPQITARANFMRGTMVSIDWTFPVFDQLSSFEISGGIGEITGEALDPFIIPAMDVQIRGNINDISFNYFGNDDVMEGDFAMDYENLKVELLKDDGTEKRSVLSALANLLVENEGEAGIQENKIEVERVKNRSFWNFLWLGLRKGLIEIVEQF